jgi:hypothetical protein
MQAVENKIDQVMFSVYALLYRREHLYECGLRFLSAGNWNDDFLLNSCSVLTHFSTHCQPDDCGREQNEVRTSACSCRIVGF